jgi:1,2-diacylglycerol-3-alpha-glucose alpha-1,2-galactosyltransferase
MKIHVVSETPFMMKATGVHTAFMDHVELLKEKNDIEVVVNDEGTGNVFHGHTYGLYYIWKGRKYKGRRVFTAHVIPDSIKGSLPLWWLFMPFIRLGLKIVYSYADVCIAISPVVEKAIIETGAKTKIVRIYNPVHINTWKRTEENRKKGRQSLGIADNEFVVIGAGQLTGRKGVDDFIDIAEAIPEAKFVWAGGRPFGGLSEGKNRINQRLSNTGKNFIYAGQIELEQMPAIYAAADLMIFPSYQENCPLAPIEAAACGMPVIYRDIKEYRSLYEYPYLKTETIEGFISLTKKMIQDKEFYYQGLKISQQLLNQFDKDNIRIKLINIYQSLLNDYQPSKGSAIRGILSDIQTLNRKGQVVGNKS